mmetsp:Transcript_807/g.1699  ORF Transcript_807/g.1699 Transcript_807/m.1699 type:complete len:223 (-) Transcript_807:1355-2023(-)
MCPPEFLVRSLASLDEHVQSISCVNCGSGSHAHGMIQVIRMLPDIGLANGFRLVEFKFEASQGHCQGHNSFHHGKFVANTLSGTGAKRHERKVRSNFVGIEKLRPLLGIETLPFWDIGVLVRPGETLGIEGVGVGPESFVSVNVVQRQKDIHSSDNGCLSSTSGGQGVFRSASSDQEGRLRVHSQAFGNYQADVFHLLDVLISGVTVTDNSVDFFENLGHDV